MCNPDINLKGIPDDLAMIVLEKALLARACKKDSLSPIQLESGETAALLIQYIESGNRYDIRIPTIEKAWIRSERT